MRRIGVLTATRAEYGLLRPVIQAIRADPGLDCRLYVTGTHLEERYGFTVREIEADGIRICARIPLGLSGDTSLDVARVMSTGIISFTQVLEEDHPDLLVVLGDRFELLSVLSAATMCKIPVAHIHGGEITEGAIDDSIRHAVTKLSYLHFCSTETYRMRVIQMGEEPSRVFNSGSLAIDNIRNAGLVSLENLKSDLAIDFSKPVAAITFHPVTNDQDAGLSELKSMLGALSSLPHLQCVFTGTNADPGRSLIATEIREFVQKNSDRAIEIKSLGMRRYLSLVRYSNLVLGNSSSGVLEAPWLGTPSVNIGRRQHGRYKAPSVIDVPGNPEDILAAINLCLLGGVPFADDADVFGDGHAAEKIVSILRDFDISDANEGKKFFDVNFSEGKAY
ncbi:UDP-N-acetylglucosamine 2-epimerase [Thalassospira sp. GO-4]|uniref:UDP-N-acetylglucosamine 2-epimerase n=1 Tax=Thalassospira sp. GO-4 TaxID=2946605 RepID=UPI002024CB2C|nr:UDP-N-acetylglucosamine 2-epimerase [Thalassospira sp. GO-4]URK17332.1 UDP-N-acetylglucosamine 2-epimerase [Thalassospira sp. GO-4]